jgi:DNA-binding MarR family transcriptional regulator
MRGKDPSVNKQNEELFAFFNEVGIISQLGQTVFERVMPGGMTIAQFTVLNHFILLGVEKKGPAELARALQVTKATMTSTLQRLESKGLVAIAPDPSDGRSKHVSITEAGRSMREDCRKALLPELEKFRPLLGSVYIPGLTRDLARIRAILEANRD